MFNVVRNDEMKAKRILFVFLAYFKSTLSEFYTFPFNNKSIAVGGRQILNEQFYRQSKFLVYNMELTMSS